MGEEQETGTPETGKADREAKAYFIQIAGKVGWSGLAASAVFIGLTFLTFDPTPDSQGNWPFAMSMMGARTFGIISFLAGAALVAMEQWTSGTLLFLGSTVLPGIAFVYFGTI